MVTAPQSANATVDTIRGYFNAYLLHTLYMEHLVHDLGAADLLSREWIQPSTKGNVYNNLKKLLTVLKYNVKNLAQLVSTAVLLATYILYSYCCMFIVVEWHLLWLHKKLFNINKQESLTYFNHGKVQEPTA